MYGTQTPPNLPQSICRFENDVKMYGTQTGLKVKTGETAFENDVKMYGTQTIEQAMSVCLGLRMM